MEPDNFYTTPAHGMRTMLGSVRAASDDGGTGPSGTAGQRTMTVADIRPPCRSMTLPSSLVMNQTIELMYIRQCRPPARHLLAGARRGNPS